MSYPKSERRQRKERIQQLRRRADFLEKRIEGYQGKNPSYDKHELSALRWAIEIIEREYPDLVAD